MERFFEFVVNHWILSTLWVLLLAALLFHLKRKSGATVSLHQTTLLINRSNGVVLDIRDKKEFDKGHIVNALNIPLPKLSERLRELEKHKDSPVIVVCQMGQQSPEAVRILTQAGFTHVVRMAGGMAEWRAQSLPLVTK